MKIGFKNNLQYIISSEIQQTDSNHIVWQDAPANFDQFNHKAKLVNGQVQILSEEDFQNELFQQRLRIRRLYGDNIPDEQLKFINYTLGTKKITPERDQGAKIRAEYVDQVNDDTIVDKIFRDVPNVRIVHGVETILDLEITHRWYKEDGTIGLTKVEIVKSFTATDVEELYQKRRNFAINFLTSAVKGTPFESYINTLMTHYQTEITSYLSPQGSNAFQEAIENEDDPGILAILESRVPFTADPNFTIRVKDSILYQIHGITREAMLGSLLPA